MGLPDDLTSIPGVSEVALFVGDGPGPERPPRWLIEVPHGATRRRDYDRILEALVGSFPEDLIEFFFVNTDVGSIECARMVAGALADCGDGGVLVLRGLIPRTFADCNRVLDGGPSAEVKSGLTPGLPEYVTDGRDAETLAAMHGRYLGQAERAYDHVCGAGGQALMLHTYAPRSIRIDRIDDGIVPALRRAYRPGVYERWERRPEVDLISEDADGRRLAHAGLVASLREEYARIGVEPTENATYRLMPETMGYVHACRHPGQTLCVEISRDLLADPFDPFVEMRIAPEKVARMARPIAAALRRCSSGGAG